MSKQKRNEDLHTTYSKAAKKRWRKYHEKKQKIAIKDTEPPLSEQIKYKNKIKGYLSGGALLFLISIFIFMAAFYISDIARHTVWSFFILGCFFWACATYSILCYIYPESKKVAERRKKRVFKVFYALFSLYLVWLVISTIALILTVGTPAFNIQTAIINIISDIAAMLFMLYIYFMLYQCERENPHSLEVG